MFTVSGVDWEQVLLPQTPLLEILARGTLTYLALFFILRIVLKRQAGTVGITDLLVVVLLADASQNALSGDYRSITDGLLLVGTIIFWNYALDWVAFHFPRLQHVIYPPPLPLIKNGQLLRQNMRRELISEDELLSQVRQQGTDDLQQVKIAFMESDGRISVITDEKAHGNRKRQVS